MEAEAKLQLGILLVLFGGFFLVDMNSSLPFGTEFLIMLLGLFIGIVGALDAE